MDQILEPPTQTAIRIRHPQEDEIPVLRALLNSSYRDLAAQGLNYTASYQDEDLTRRRMAEGRAFILEDEGDIIGTVLFSKKNYFTNRRTAYVSQLGISNVRKGQGLGKSLMDYCEKLAKDESFEGLQLDTAIPATRLVNWYLRLGYKIVGETQWDGKTYRSYVFEKQF